MATDLFLEQPSPAGEITNPSEQSHTAKTENAPGSLVDIAVVSR